ncbi:hypothetical protein KSS87_016469 [Heliosperma pusillum]|nr:hypothetical protein KSS87_016469 [Heliosperma pusillum]
MEAHKLSPTKLYICDKARSSSSSEIIFGFSGSWDLSDWFTHEPFGLTKINLNIFPSLKTIGWNKAASVNQGFLQKFDALLANTSLIHEVEAAATENKQIVFTGHSSGGPIAIFATLWYLEIRNQKNLSHLPPHCVTFGSPLVGDRIFGHSLKRQHYYQHFTHFVMKYDIIPRISLAPLSAIERQLSPILNYFNPESPVYSSDAIAANPEASRLFLTVMRSASSVTSHAACKFMGCTNPLLENLTNFIELSPYRPFGTYVFCSGNGKFVMVENPDAILQILFYSLQATSQAEWANMALKSLKDHLSYEHEFLKSNEMATVAYLEHLEALPLSEHMGESQILTINNALNDLGLSARARLCLRASGELEIQRARNYNKISSNKIKIEEGLTMLERYQTNCEDRKVGYYDAFKLQKHTEDFNNNIRRLELAGSWDEIIEMMNRYELPDEFEGQKEWIEIGTRYRRLVEPLDIANYYRHLKNEDTGPYMDKARPTRYRHTQRWLEHGLKTKPDPLPESCFWAEVEELSIHTCNQQFSEDVMQRIILLERKVSLWVENRLLGKDIFLDGTTFTQWWNMLPIQHRSVSCIKDLFHMDSPVFVGHI